MLAGLGAERIDVLWVGKAGTFGLMFAYPAFLLGHGTGRLAGRRSAIIAWVTGLVGLALAWIAAVATSVRPAGPWPTGRAGPGPGRAERGGA